MGSGTIKHPQLWGWRCRLAACQLVSAFPGEETLVQARRQALAECAAAAFFAETGLIEPVRNAMTVRVQIISSVLESKSETHARQLSLERWQISSLQPALQHVRQQVARTGVLLSFQEQPAVVLALRMGPQDRIETLSRSLGFVRHHLMAGACAFWSRRPIVRNSVFVPPKAKA